MLGQINHSLKRLSRAEKRVAEWVLAHPREVAEATVADVARAAGTSQPTGAKRIAASSGSGGSCAEDPAQTAPSCRAKACPAV